MTRDQIIGANIRTYAEKAKYSQRDLSILTGIPQPSLCSYIRGNTGCSESRLELIATALECTVEDLKRNPIETVVDETNAECVPVSANNYDRIFSILRIWEDFFDDCKIVDEPVASFVSIMINEKERSLLMLQRKYAILAAMPDSVFSYEDYKGIMEKQMQKYMEENR